MKKLTEHATDGQYQPESLQVRRLGSRANTETGTDEARSRPLLVTFSGEDKKASVMKNLHKLRNKGEPFSEMVIKHDMSREDREKERLLQKEAREKTQQEQTTNVVYIVRGRPGERQIIKVKKERNEQPNSGTSVGEIIVWYSNADVLTKDKLTELKCRLNNNSTPPHIIAVEGVLSKGVLSEGVLSKGVLPEGVLSYLRYSYIRGKTLKKTYTAGIQSGRLLDGNHKYE